MRCVFHFCQCCVLFYSVDVNRFGFVCTVTYKLRKATVRFVMSNYLSDRPNGTSGPGHQEGSTSAPLPTELQYLEQKGGGLRNESDDSCRQSSY